jgi:hypothetical protein
MHEGNRVWDLTLKSVEQEGGDVKMHICDLPRWFVAQLTRVPVLFPMFI